MPEFENLDRYVDPASNRITPVAPHSGAAHDYVPRKREGTRATPLARRSSLPDIPSSKGAPRITTEEMERAYRDAMKASRARRRAHDRKTGNTFFGRLRKWWADKLAARKEAQAQERAKRATSPKGEVNASGDQSSKRRPRGGKGRRPEERSGGASSGDSNKNNNRRPRHSRGNSRDRQSGGPQGASQGSDSEAGNSGKRRRSRPRKQGHENDNASARKQPTTEKKPETSGPAQGSPEGGERKRRRRNRRRNPSSSSSSSSAGES